VGRSIRDFEQFNFFTWKSCEAVKNVFLSIMAWSVERAFGSAIVLDLSEIFAEFHRRGFSLLWRRRRFRSE
jgi:hypothetical protein